MDSNTPSLPTNLEDMGQRLALFRTEAGNDYAAAFKPRASDVLINTYPKTGTTWMQQIIHGLRTSGDMDFAEITQVVPWIEMAYDMGIDLTADHRGEPRAFKTHYAFHETPEDARHIYIIRDPRDVAVSMYHFFEGWFFVPGTIDFATFTTEFFINGSKSGTYWDHVASWWPERHRENVLFLAYENMKKDLPGTVQRVVEFTGVDASPEDIEIATRQSTAEFMKAHEGQFDDNLLVAARNPAMGLPLDASSSKVRDGKPGGHKAHVTEELEAELDAVWSRVVETKFGFKTYNDMLAALNS